MQDGAPPHTARDTITLLKTIFRRRLVALGTDVEWAPHSPDLNPLDFWFWGAAKEAVYVKCGPARNNLEVTILVKLKNAVSNM